ncbi:MAG: hypothetical protein QXU30_07280 [Sulfolobales archaeon]
MVVQSVRFNSDYVVVKYVCVGCGREESVKTTFEEGIKVWGRRR